MRILVSIDDTDNLESRGTGEIGEDRLDQVITFAGHFLDTECAEGSDPGCASRCWTAWDLPAS